MYKDKFVMSVLYNNKPLREIRDGDLKKVVIPFNSEYKILLKNKHIVPCTASVSIDGRKISELGDFIIHGKSSIILERFVIDSLDKGKRFKFVKLDHPDVNDPYEADNGIIEVEFRRTKNKVIELHDMKNINSPTFDWSYTENRNTGWFSSDTFYYSNNSGSVFDNIVFSDSSCVDSGATVEGSSSDQQFMYSSLDVSKNPDVILRLKMVGVSNKYSNLDYKFCTKCGYKANYGDNYCVICGTKF